MEAASRPSPTPMATVLCTTIQFDQDGDGDFDRVETIAVQANGSSVDTVFNYTPNGTLNNKTITTTSADGLSTTVTRDVTGDGVTDRTTKDIIVLNADGSRIETVAEYNADNSF